MCLDVPLPGVGTDLVQVPADYQGTSSESWTIVTADGTIELTDSEADLEHVHKELLMVALVLRSQADRLYNRRVCIFVDAVASMAYICDWGGPSIFLTRLVKLIWSICARFGIRIVQVSHSWHRDDHGRCGCTVPALQILEGRRDTVCSTAVRVPERG